jgi:hypothetical protein
MSNQSQGSWNEGSDERKLNTGSQQQEQLKSAEIKDETPDIVETTPWSCLESFAGFSVVESLTAEGETSEAQQEDIADESLEGLELTGRFVNSKDVNMEMTRWPEGWPGNFVN